jgi:endoglucanase
VGVHVGEFGVERHTSHATALAWMQDCLELWKEADWGWCLWNLNGELGVIDSNRADVKYEDFRGHKLDRQMLNLLQSH